MSVTPNLLPAAARMPVEMLPLDAMLSTIPSLPRPILARLTARMIDRMDELDGDPDLEDGDEDRCAVGEDEIVGGPVCGWQQRYRQRFRLMDGEDPDCRRNAEQETPHE